MVGSEDPAGASSRGEPCGPDVDETCPGPRAHRHPPFGQAVGFLLSQLGFEVSRRFGLLMAEVGLEPRHFAVLRAIEAHDGSPQNTVGEVLRIPASSMVGIVDHLEGLGVVERRPHPSDRRSRTLHLTEHGRGVLDRAVDLAMGFEDVMTAGLAPAQRAELTGMLTTVAANLGLGAGQHPGSTDDPDPAHPGSPHGAETAAN